MLNAIGLSAEILRQRRMAAFEHAVLRPQLAVMHIRERSRSIHSVTQGGG